ncbi:MAG: hypothetical protein A2Z25_05010 [Planctomycetes bacterium RBG_16_55_9]|nr:MAG: hypothetical protein A2Z25_05010 [Planctomycetes bacterium RBG_16_55_9]
MADEFDKIQDRARRLIKSEFSKRGSVLQEEVGRIMRKMRISGMDRSSIEENQIRAACDGEIDTRATIVWNSVRRAYEAVGAPTTGALAADFKKEVNRHIEEIVKDVSEFMARRLSSRKLSPHLLDFESTKHAVEERIGVEVDLYVDSLLSKKTAETEEKIEPEGQVKMIYGDIEKDLASWRDFLRFIKKDVSSGQIRNYGNVLNGLKRLSKPIVSLRNEQKDETILRACNHLEESRKELQDIVSDSLNEPTSWVKVTNRLDDLIDELDELSELLAETPQKKDGQRTIGRPRGTKQVSRGTSKPKTKPARDQVFICYSRKDKQWLSDLNTHLKPYVRNGSVTPWSDEQITPSSRWFEEIKAALDRTRVAVLLVTPDFLASDFIREHELTPLLKEAEKGGVHIIWIPVRACSYKETALKDYQAVGDPDKPLANMKANRDKAWVEICENIKRAVSR